MLHGGNQRLESSHIKQEKIHPGGHILWLLYREYEHTNTIFNRPNNIEHHIWMYGSVFVPRQCSNTPHARTHARCNDPWALCKHVCMKCKSAGTKRVRMNYSFPLMDVCTQYVYVAQYVCVCVCPRFQHFQHWLVIRHWSQTPWYGGLCVTVSTHTHTSIDWLKAFLCDEMKITEKLVMTFKSVLWPRD